MNRLKDINITIIYDIIIVFDLYDYIYCHLLNSLFYNENFNKLDEFFFIYLNYYYIAFLTLINYII